MSATIKQIQKTAFKFQVGNIQINEDSSMLKVFITNLSEYNNGNLVGEWISLPTDSSFLNQQIRKVLSSDDSEEIFITDWEWEDKIIFEIGEYDNPQQLNAKLFKIKGLSVYQQEAITFLISEGICTNDHLEDCINKSYDVVIHRNKTMADIAQERIKEMVGLAEVPSIITNHIDYNSMGEEIKQTEYFVEDNSTIYEYIG